MRLLLVLALVLSQAPTGAALQRDKANSQKTANDTSPERVQIITQPVTQPSDSSGEKIAYYTKWLMGFTGVLAAGTLGLFLLSWRQGKQIERQFAAEQRPWIPLDIQLASSWLWVSDGSGRITLRFLLRNTGRTPAIHVSIDAIIYPGLGELSPLKEQRRLYEKHRAAVAVAAGEGLGLTIFPDDKPTGTVDYEMVLTAAQIEDAVAWFKAANNTDLDAWTLSPMIIGTITYRYVWNLEKHQTGFIVELRPSFHPRDGDIPPDRLRLSNWIAGSPVID